MWFIEQFPRHSPTLHEAHRYVYSKDVILCLSRVRTVTGPLRPTAFFEGARESTSPPYCVHDRRVYRDNVSRSSTIPTVAIFGFSVSRTVVWSPEISIVDTFVLTTLHTPITPCLEHTQAPDAVLKSNNNENTPLKEQVHCKLAYPHHTEARPPRLTRKHPTGIRSCNIKIPNTYSSCIRKPTEYEQLLYIILYNSTEYEQLLYNII